MKQIFSSLLISAEKVNAVQRFNFLIALQRAVLQHAAIAACEFYISEHEEPELRDAFDIMRQVVKPNDRTPIDILDCLIPRLRMDGWTACGHGWFEIKEDLPDSLKGRSLVRNLERWLEFRNDRPGHGVLDSKTISQSVAWQADLVRESVASLKELLPYASLTSGSLTLETPLGPRKLSTLRLVEGSPIVVRAIRNRGSAWVVRNQTLHWDQSNDGTYEIAPTSPLVSLCAKVTNQYECRTVHTGGKIWKPLVSLPSRQTRIFEGRSNELSQLNEWFNNLDSKACLIYGDGGVGKTTLVLQFLNDLLEVPPSTLTFKPEVICYYTAKQTKWGPDGLVHFRGLQPVLMDAIRQLAHVIEDVITRDWYPDNDEAVIDKAITLFTEAGLKKDEVLLVIDNAETLVRNPGEEKVLQRHISKISQRLCRLIVTSRRAEKVEAFPIGIEPMSEDTGAILLERLAKEYNAPPFLAAGEARLRRVCRELDGKPLLMDALVRYCAHTRLSIDESFNRVIRAEERSLSNFLFEDAWRRITESQRKTFLILSRISAPINARVVAWACEAAGQQHQSWLDAFNETDFGALNDYGTDYDITFRDLAKDFFGVEYSRLPQGARDSINGLAVGVDRKHKALVEAEHTQVDDRVVKAFRTGAARAAKLAVKRGDYDDAELWYQSAVEIDATNSALFDRYAWFQLAERRDLNKAEALATRAHNLDPADPEPWFTLGVIKNRRMDVGAADMHLEQAEKRGKPISQCRIQGARGRIYLARKETSRRRKAQLLDEADRLLLETKENVLDRDPFKGKIIREAMELQQNADNMRRQLMKHESYN